MKSPQVNKASLKEFIFQTPKGPVRIYHNCPDTPGLRIFDAYPNWQVRTNVVTAHSFVEYINSKTHLSGSTAYTEEQYKALK